MRVGSLFAEAPSEVTVDYTAAWLRRGASSAAATARSRTLRLGRSRPGSGRRERPARPPRFRRGGAQGARAARR
jgi:hypothetical protein